MSKNIYLDYAAATPVDKQVVAAMQPYLVAKFYNPSSLYMQARQIRQALNTARHAVAKALGAKPGEVIFTAGATESINLAISGIAKAFPKGNIVISAIEHEAVVAAAKAAFGIKVKVCPVQPDGTLDLQQLAKLIDVQTVLVSVMYANNEVGSIQPLAKVSKILKNASSKRRGGMPVYLHTDASQAANYLDLKVARLGVDLLTLNGGKIYGPKQTGCLYMRGGVKLDPLIYGGGQERGLRSGTENVTGFIGFARALEIAVQKQNKESKRVAILRDHLVNKLLTIPGVSLNGGVKHRLPNNINISIKGIDGERLVHYLDHAGVMAATGAACSANKDATSPTLLGLGLSKNQANSSLRLSLGRQTTKVQVDSAAKTIHKLVDRLRAQS